ncbi:MAG: RNA polymerase sigma-54 factor, partial [Myxococcota bacterium]
MALDLRLQQKMSQLLVMTPQLQQAIKLLQLNHLELSEVLAKEMEENPMLEDGQGEERTEEIERLDGIEETVAAPSADSEKPGAEGDNQTASDLQSVLDAPVDATPEPTSKEKEKEIDWESYLESNTYALPATAGGQDELPPFEASLTKSESLHDHLRWQVQMGDFNEHEMAIAAMLIEEINDDGYLTADAVDIVCDEMELDADEVLSVLRMIQQFDPRGVGARNLRECLLLQVEELADEQPLMVDIIDRHLPNVEKRNYQAIVKDLKVTLPEVGEALKAIGQLEPRPGRLYSDQEPRYITPDIYVVRVGDGYEILLNEDGLPKLKISNYYRDALQNSNGKE